MRGLQGTWLVLSLAVPGAAQPAPGPAERPDFRDIARKADALLRKENGTKLALDAELSDQTSLFRKVSNKVRFVSNNADRRLVCLTVEPVDQENEETVTLVGALLVAVSAVDSLEEGVRMANLLTSELDKDGRPRSVTLQHGIKLQKFKSGEAGSRFQVLLP